MQNICDYVDEIDDTYGFSKDNIIVEHRSNNAKRDFLFVNKAQCMHIPNDPGKIINMCKMLADRVKATIPQYKRIMVIGFAETATAIGNLVADNLPDCKFVMTTTREDIPRGKTIVNFKEEHSHAPSQKLVTYEHIDIINDFDYILFVEDEISTGKTILNFIDALEKYAEGKGAERLPHFGVASVCNWQNDVNREKFNERKIDVVSLIYGKLKDVNKKMELTEFRTTPFNTIQKNVSVSHIFTSAMAEERLGHAPNRNLMSLYKKGMEKYKPYEHKHACSHVRVIGTEECKYPAIKFAEFLKNNHDCLGVTVLCQSTTRSPIDVTSLSGDGITSKHSVPSVYEKGRKNYIYNIDSDVLNIVITDADINKKEKNAFRNVLGNDCIFVRMD